MGRICLLMAILVMAFSGCASMSFKQTIDLPKPVYYNGRVDGRRGTTTDPDIVLAVLNGDARKVEKLLKEGHDPNTMIGVNIGHPLKDIAIYYNYAEITRMLLAAGATSDDAFNVTHALSYGADDVALIYIERLLSKPEYAGKKFIVSDQVKDLLVSKMNSKTLEFLLGSDRVSLSRTDMLVAACRAGNQELADRFFPADPSSAKEALEKAWKGLRTGYLTTQNASYSQIAGLFLQKKVPELIGLDFEAKKIKAKPEGVQFSVYVDLADAILQDPFVLDRDMLVRSQANELEFEFLYKAGVPARDADTVGFAVTEEKFSRFAARKYLPSNGVWDGNMKSVQNKYDTMWALYKKARNLDPSYAKTEAFLEEMLKGKAGSGKK